MHDRMMRTKRVMDLWLGYLFLLGEEEEGPFLLLNACKREGSRLLQR